MAGNLAWRHEGIDTPRLDNTTLHTPKGIYGRKGGEQERKSVSGKHGEAIESGPWEKKRKEEESERKRIRKAVSRFAST